MATTFRDFIPTGRHPRLGHVNFKAYNAYSWVDFGKQSPMICALFEGWQKLYEEPFRGITANGELEPNLFELRNEKVPVDAMVEAAALLIQQAEKAKLGEKLRYPIDSREWRCWMNPEFYVARHGLRLEEIPEGVRAAALGLIKASLSEKGYAQTLAAMRVNGFLGDLVGAPQLMNEQSYNVILFGEPSSTQPWGWSLWGHHLSFCVFVLGSQMVVSPVFRGCEPNEIDAGEHAGTEMFTEEMRLATAMMRSLSDEERSSVIVYDSLDHPDMPDGFPHSADGRNLAGAYEDNRIITPIGGQLSRFSPQAQQAVLHLVEKFIDFLPDGPLVAKMDDLRRHLNRTWLMWMGAYGEKDVFHFRIHSPVLICEFDHECGMWLTNAEPGRFHVHTVVRTPNGNDYGKELLRALKARH